MKNRTGLVWHELYMWHNTGNHAGIMPAGLNVEPYRHVENPDSKRRIKNLLDVSGLSKELTFIDPVSATKEQVLRVHTDNHVYNIESANETGGHADPFSPFGVGSYDIALLSAGGVIQLVDAVMNGDVDNGYALVRPPGHHAVPDSGMGFCLFCNAAIAARHAQDKHGLKRIAFVDWDVHHGNGAEAIFWNDPSVLTISVHQDRCFPPDTGHVTDNGEGEGEGYNINIPLPAGSGFGAYEATFDRVVIPALEAYKPEMIIVPSGFDAGAYDPLGRQMMHSDGYRALTAKLMAVADKVCDGRIIMCHEGGYEPTTVPYFALAVIEQLSGHKTDITDPFMEMHGGLAGQELQDHQDEYIQRAEALLKKIS